MSVTLNPELAAIIAAPGITNQLQACAAFKNALGNSRRIIALHNGVEFRNCALSGMMQSIGGSITGLGITSGDTAARAADLSTGNAVLRLVGGGHTVEGSLGLPGSGCTFIIEANPTVTNGLALVNINIPLRQDLPMGGPGANVPYRIELEDWQSGVAGARTSIEFDENAGDITWDMPARAAETGPIPYWRSTQTFKHGSGGKSMEIGFHRATLPAQCNDEANVPVYEVFGFTKPYNRWPKYPAMESYNAATDSTFLAPCKFYIYDVYNSLLGVIEMHDDLPLNSPQMGQTRNSTTAWRPFVHCKQMLYWSSHRLKLSASARKFANGMVPGTSNRPGQTRQNASANRAFPALPTGYVQVNGFGQWFYMPPWPLSTTADYPSTDPFAPTGGASDPTGNPNDGGRNGARAIGYMFEPGAPAAHDWYGPAGGNAMDRFFMASPRAAYLTEPNGVRPQGSVPYKLLNYEYNKGYFNHAHHDVLDPRTAATLPHEEVAYGGWAYCNGKYTTQGPIFVAGGESRHINLFGAGYNPPPKDKDGLLPYHGWENDALHAYTHPAWFALDYNSVAAVFSAMMRYNSTMMSFGPSGSPSYGYDGMIMQRMHAWRWHNQNLMWMVGSSHPALLSQAKIEARFLPELEMFKQTMVDPTTTPAHPQYNSLRSIGLRNFGIPAIEVTNSGAGTHYMAAVDDAKLLYLGGVLSVMETSGITDRMKALSSAAGASIEAVKGWVYNYAVNQFSATRGRKLFWMINQLSPAVPAGQPLVAYNNYADWAAVHAPVNGQEDLVRNADGTPYYAERQQYQHLMVQTIFQFRDYLGGESKWPGINAVCAIAQEQEDYKANLIASNYYNGIFGDYEYRWPAAGIQAPPQA